MATALNNNLRGRETAIARLTSLATTLPAQAQAGIARAIAAISGNPTGVVNIAGALNSGDITPAAQPQLEQALTLASGAMFTGVDQLKQIVGMLPAPAQGPVNMAITRVTGILQSIFGNGSPTVGRPAACSATCRSRPTCPSPAACRSPVPAIRQGLLRRSAVAPGSMIINSTITESRLAFGCGTSRRARRRAGPGACRRSAEGPLGRIPRPQGRLVWARGCTALLRGAGCIATVTFRGGADSKRLRLPL